MYAAPLPMQTTNRVTAAIKPIEQQKVNHALIWVQANKSD